jgi:hypothetical protein
MQGDSIAPVHLEPFKFTCIKGNCPTIYRTDRDTFVIQGAIVADADLQPSEGETLVEVPQALLRDLPDA